MRKQIAALVAVGLVIGGLSFGSPAFAETISKADPDPRCSQAPPLDVKRATFTYTPDAFVTRIQMGALTKRTSQVFSRFYVGNDRGVRYGVQLVSAFRRGELRTTGYWTDYEEGDYSNRFRRGVTARWDRGDDAVVFRLTSHLRGKRVDAAAYSVAKGADHGPACGDYIFVSSLERG